MPTVHFPAQGHGLLRAEVVTRQREDSAILFVVPAERSAPSAYSSLSETVLSEC
jgi:hypothetical protein